MPSGDSELGTITQFPLTYGSERPHSTNSTIRCVPHDSYAKEFIELSFAATTLPVHLFVIIAMIAYRNIVKRNVVNLYAGNLIFASVVSNVWRIYINGEVIDKSHIDEHDGEEFTPDIWEKFKQGLNIALLLVISGSIGLVINAMRSIQFRVHKTVGGLANRATAENCMAKKKCSRRERLNTSRKNHPKTWAAFLIGMIWLIPLLLAIFSAIFNSCTYICQCDLGLTLGGENPGVNCIEDHNSTFACSTFIPPLSRTMLIVGFCLWLLYLFVLTFSLFKTFKDLRHLKIQRCESSVRVLSEENKMKNLESGTQGNSESTSSAKDQETEQFTIDNAQVGISRNSSKGRRSVAIKLSGGEKNCTRISGSIFIQNLRKNFHLLVAMYMAYVIGTLPIAAIIIVDGIGGISRKDNVTNLPIQFVIIFLLPIVAEVICTIVVCRYLSGVKLSVRSLMVKLTGC